MRKLTPAALGLGAGIATGMVAEASSGLYADEDRGDLRVTAHSALPFLVVAVRAASGSGPDHAAPWRAGFVGAHLVHARQIVRLLRGGAARDPEIRAALGLGSVGYAMVLTQAALLGGPARRWAGPGRADRWSEAIDTSLLRVYALACLGGLIRHRRPVGVYVLIAALLAVAFGSRRKGGAESTS